MQRFLLWLVGLMCPAFIACTYGTPYAYTKYGYVKDQATSAGIPDIQMSFTCDTHWMASVSDAQGFFRIDYDTACQEMTYTDTDGADGGGDYGTGQVAFDKNASQLLIQLTKK